MEYTAIVPLMNRVLVQRLSLPAMTAGGIIIPQKPDSASRIGKVINVGQGAVLASGKELKPTVRIGDYVLVNDWAGTQLPPKKEDKDKSMLYLYNEDDLLGVVSKYKH